MGNAIDDRQFTKVFVESDEDTIFVMSVCENLIITGIFFPIAGPDDVMSG